LIAGSFAGISVSKLTHVRATIANPARPAKRARLRFLIDSGAVYSVAPATLLHRLGIEPHGTRTFTLADGTEIHRSVGDATFIVSGERAASPVIFGEKGDSLLLGTVSLEALGFMLDLFKRTLEPLPVVLG
jgi:predicted aspartyl protease